MSTHRGATMPSASRRSAAVDPPRDHAPTSTCRHPTYALSAWPRRLRSPVGTPWRRPSGRPSSSRCHWPIRPRTCSDTPHPPTWQHQPTRRTCPAGRARRRRPSHPSLRRLEPTWHSAPTRRIALPRRATDAPQATAITAGVCPRRRSGDPVHRVARRKRT